MAGVSVSSASRVLSKHADVSTRMRRKVMSAVDQLGYEPDFLAQSMRSGATFSVGFVARDISSPLLAEIAHGAETTLRKGGYSMLVLSSEGDPALDAGHIRQLAYRRVDGVLISLADEHNPDALSALRELSVPAVLIDREVRETLTASAVLADHVAGMRAVLSHLAGLGHRRVGLVGGPQAVRPGREGAAAFSRISEELGLEATVESGPFTHEHGRDATARLLGADARPTAIISGSNQILPGVLLAIREHGLSIPADLSLATFDDLPLLGLLEPPVDVVRRGPGEFGSIAANLLLRRIAAEPPETVVVPTTFEVRGSSGPPAE
ncbi:MAG: substrate-binding domain-containing protein [Actinobacteria bacterium]|nr:substrate-binding domain-containing protein [Actinomycetota bacterium]